MSAHASMILGYVENANYAAVQLIAAIDAMPAAMERVVLPIHETWPLGAAECVIGHYGKHASVRHCNSGGKELVVLKRAYLEEQAAAAQK